MTFSGLFIPLITPFAPDGSVALPALETLAHDLLDAGATGLLALGTTAEPSALTPAERHDVLSVVARVSRSRDTPWIAAVHDGVVPDSASAAMHTVPAFVRPGEQGVIAHFAALAAASPLPIVIYHVPYRTAQPLSAPALLRLASLPGVAAMKYAPGMLDADAIQFLAAVPPHRADKSAAARPESAARPEFAVLAGDDVLAGPLLALGAAGAILASAHVATAGFAALVAAWRSGDVDTARELGRRLAPLSSALFAAPNPTVIKAVLHRDGRIPTSAVRPPLLPAAPALLAAVPAVCPPAPADRPGGASVRPGGASVRPGSVAAGR